MNCLLSTGFLGGCDCKNDLKLLKYNVYKIIQYSISNIVFSGLFNDKVKKEKNQHYVNSVQSFLKSHPCGQPCILFVFNVFCFIPVLFLFNYFFFTLGSFRSFLLYFKMLFLLSLSLLSFPIPFSLSHFPFFIFPPLFLLFLLFPSFSHILSLSSFHFFSTLPHFLFFFSFLIFTFSLPFLIFTFSFSFQFLFFLSSYLVFPCPFLI